MHIAFTGVHNKTAIPLPIASMQMEPIFRDRVEAGRILAERVSRSIQDPKSLVLALPRGGVPVGFEVAHALRAELNIFLVRKLGLPDQINGGIAAA